MPFDEVRCEPSDKVNLSQATVSNCIARIRDRIPVPVADTARGSNPIGVVPSRVPASGDLEQQILRHCLVNRKKKCFNTFEIWILFERYSQAS